MNFIIFLLCFSIIGIQHIKQYRKTGKVYKLLFLIPIISAIIIEFIDKFMHKSIGIVVPICICILYIICGVVDWKLDKI